MFRFLIKGIFRDRHRYLFPLIIVAGGIMILVFTLAFMKGYVGSFIRHNANFETGHLKVVTNAYAQRINLKPIELAMLDIGDELEQWKQAYPQLEWVKRVSFGALLDVPDSTGLTRFQGEVAGFAIDFLNSPKEIERMKLDKSLEKGKLPSTPGEILLSAQAFDRLELRLGDPVTLISSTVDGAMAMQNFSVVGAVNFGVATLDKGAVVADFEDICSLADMEGGAGEILAYFRHGEYRAREVKAIRDDFNARFSGEGEFDPVMISLSEQNNMGYLIRLMDQSFGIMATIFVLIMGIVLWNSGLMNGIRRWGEFGVRLAVGERKSHVYRSLLLEAVVIGIVGSAIGALLGALISLYFKKNGIDLTAYGQNSTIVADNVIYTTISLPMLLTAFIPGVFSTLLGAALAGIAIFKRQTSQLFKELET